MKPSRPNIADGFFESLECRRLLSGWGAVPQLIGQDQAAAAFSGVTGAGESIAVLDTGIDYNAPQLGGGFGPGHKVVAGWNFIDNNGNPMDTVGHGTGVAGIIAATQYSYGGQLYQGLAPGANLIALKIDDGVNDPPTDRIAAALQWVIDHKEQYNIVAVNISEGNGLFGNKTIQGVYGDKLQTLANEGVFIAASSGNDFSTTGVEDIAADPNVAGVGSVDAADHVSVFSDSGSNLDLLAPGENVPLLYLDGSGNEIVVPGSGTSFSSPFVASAAALVHQLIPSLSPAAIRAELQQSGTAVTDSRSGATFQRLNLFNALSEAIPAAPVPVSTSATAPQTHTTAPQSTVKSARHHATHRAPRHNASRHAVKAVSHHHR